MLKIIVVNKSKERGITLLEIVIAMSVVGVLAALGMPNLFSMLDRNNLDQSLDKLQGAIQNAQRQALRKSQYCRIQVFQGSDAYKLAGLNRQDVTAATDGDPRTTTDWKKSQDCVIQGEQVTVTLLGGATANTTGFNLPSGVQLITNHNRNFIEFTSKGFPNFASGTGTEAGALIVLKATGVNEQRCVFVSPSTGITRTGKYFGDFSQPLSISQCKINSLY